MNYNVFYAWRKYTF